MTHGARLPPQGVGLKHLTGDVKSMLGRITETDQVGAGEGNLMWRLPLVGVVSVLGHSGDRQASSAQARILNGPAPQNNYPETLGKTVIINAPTGEGALVFAGPPCHAEHVVLPVAAAQQEVASQPALLGPTHHVCCAVFKMIWAMVRPMLDVRTQAKIEVSTSLCGGRRVRN